MQDAGCRTARPVASSIACLIVEVTSSGVAPLSVLRGCHGPPPDRLAKTFRPIDQPARRMLSMRSRACRAGMALGPLPIALPFSSHEATFLDAAIAVL